LTGRLSGFATVHQVTEIERRPAQIEIAGSQTSMAIQRRCSAQALLEEVNGQAGGRIALHHFQRLDVACCSRRFRMPSMICLNRGSF
jgi:hypothetical protein